MNIEDKVKHNVYDFEYNSVNLPVHNSVWNSVEYSANIFVRTKVSSFLWNSVIDSMENSVRNKIENNINEYEY